MNLLPSSNIGNQYRAGKYTLARFTYYGHWLASGLGTARNIAKSNATKNLGAMFQNLPGQPKHVGCKCTGPKGEAYRGGC